MNIALLNIPTEIRKITKDLGIPIDALNFMPGERQAELRYKNRTIGYVICSDEGNSMHYQTDDALTQKHLDWHFIYQQNQKIITEKVIKELKRTPVSLLSPGAFRKINVKILRRRIFDTGL